MSSNNIPNEDVQDYVQQLFKVIYANLYKHNYMFI